MTRTNPQLSSQCWSQPCSDRYLNQYCSVYTNLVNITPGAGEEITVTKHVARPFISIASKATGGS